MSKPLSISNYMKHIPYDTHANIICLIYIPLQLYYLYTTAVHAVYTYCVIAVLEDLKNKLDLMNAYYKLLTTF